ncbi:hypothetical protein SUGI_0532460 [Cryptomeria japonica]|uniref:pathogenesis-related protein PR-1 n=1 Tax=Cryptomeria japonica TaxID=3369 RepID=UPI002408ADC2|nr:pathogenesis-related protein PR-1 [Cryptomeria japonica]GLJ27157.1 hypothetical protein SUGI_0532460 [Cryptomeria japonica]
MGVRPLERALLFFFLLLCFSIFTEGRSLHKYNERKAEEDIVAEFLVPQNEARAKVGDPPLVWDTKVASYAEWYAHQRQSDCALKHSSGPYGENIFWGSGSAWQPKDAVNAWVGEDEYFNYHTHSCNGYEECGHYTQIVWKNSLRVGCAKVICNSGDTFMTCNYDPPGNYVGQKPY